MRRRRFSWEGTPGYYPFGSDAFVRRYLHEFGASGFDFYGGVFEEMGYRDTDIVLDIGAGMSLDGFNIAKLYGPKLIYLLEPPGNNPAEFADKFAHLELMAAAEGLSHIKVLPPKFSTPLKRPDMDIKSLPEEFSHLQPLAGVAERLPLPSRHVNKVSIVHSGVHFDDLGKGLMETARVMADDGEGVFVTNGPNDKLRFREALWESGMRLQGKPAETVSSRLTYHAAVPLLENFFEEVELQEPYEDEMVITEERKPVYLNAHNSYRYKFEKDVGEEEWVEVRRELIEQPIEAAISGPRRAFLDTIDIAAIRFRGPKKNILERLGQLANL